MLLKNTPEKRFKYTLRYKAVVIKINNSYLKDTVKSDIKFTAVKIIFRLWKDLLAP